MEYSIVRVSGGKSEEIASYVISVTASADHPLVTAGTLQFAQTPVANQVAGRVSVPGVLTQPYSFAY
jgi:hypothetical protein